MPRDRNALLPRWEGKGKPAFVERFCDTAKAPSRLPSMLNSETRTIVLFPTSRVPRRKLIPTASRDFVLPGTSGRVGVWWTVGAEATLRHTPACFRLPLGKP